MESSITKFHWMSWKASALRTFREGDVEWTGEKLVMMLCDEYYTDIDRWGERIIFTSEEFLQESKTLWDEMVKHITPEFIESIRSRLAGYGWDI